MNIIKCVLVVLFVFSMVRTVDIVGFFRSSIPPPIQFSIPDEVSEIDLNLGLISTDASSRATAYSTAQKIVSLDGKTHYSWLDSSVNGFRVRIKTYDDYAKKWSKTYTIGEAFDNHGGAAIVADSMGYLHAVYYPHGSSPFRYKKSIRKNDASEWSNVQFVGRDMTYPSLAINNQDELILFGRKTPRRIGPDPKSSLVYFTKVNEKWSNETEFIESNYIGYADFAAHVYFDKTGSILHLACLIHEKSKNNRYGLIQNIVYLYSSDFGNTWKNKNGETLEWKQGLFSNRPFSSKNFAAIESGGLEKGNALHLGALTLDPQAGPVITYTKVTKDKGDLIVASLVQGEWEKVSLDKEFKKRHKNWRLSEPVGGAAYDDLGNLFLLSTFQNIDSSQISDLYMGAWGHPSSEIILFYKERGEDDYKSKIISEISSSTANWLPHIEFSGNEIRALYSSGVVGQRNTQKTKNKVFAVNLNKAVFR